VAQKSKPLPNDQKTDYIVLKPVNGITFIRHITVKSSTIILFVGTRNSMCDLLYDLMHDPQTSHMRQIR